MPNRDGSPSTVERGYGQAHRRARTATAAVVESGGAVCSRCGRAILPGAPWDLDHSDDRQTYLGPAHRRCNRLAGASKGGRIIAARKGRRRRRVRAFQALVTSRQW